MRSLSNRDAAACNPGAVIFTMFLGVCLSVASAVVIAIGSHIVDAMINLQVAAPPLVVELMVTAYGGLLLSVAAVMGVSLALGMLDHRLQRSRIGQGIIASLGAVFVGIGLFVCLGQTVAIDFGGLVGILTFVAGDSFVLMFLRSRAHTSQ